MFGNVKLPEEVEKRIWICSPEPLMGVEVLVEGEKISLSDDCNDQEWLSEACVTMSPKPEHIVPSARTRVDVSDGGIVRVSVETSTENENRLQKAEKNELMQTYSRLDRKQTNIDLRNASFLFSSPKFMEMKKKKITTS